MNESGLQFMNAFDFLTGVSILLEFSWFLVVMLSF